VCVCGAFACDERKLANRLVADRLHFGMAESFCGCGSSVDTTVYLQIALLAYFCLIYHVARLNHL